MRRKITVLLSLTLSLGLVLTACAEDEPTIQAGGGGEHEDQGEGHEAQGKIRIALEEATYHGTADVVGLSDFELELDDFYFGPTVLEGSQSQAITLKLHNEGNVSHTFTIDGEVDEELAPGDEFTLETGFFRSGYVVFYCRFHRAQGMLGALATEGSLNTQVSNGDTPESSPGSGYDYG